MKREVEIGILRELLRQLEENVNVDAGRQFENPASAYTSPELAEREWQRLFREAPQLIGLSGDLPERGSYVTTDDFGAPVLATRDDEGRFRAFLNACRHRGTRVANEVRGQIDAFVCPFHNWTYSRAGELIGIPRERDFGAVDRSCRGLVELPAEERFGQLWVHPNPDGALDVADNLGELGEELDAWESGRLAFAGESLIERDLNWKLAIDTFGETYHVARLHRDTLGTFVHSDALVCDPFGRNQRMALALKSIDGLRDQPEESWTLDGTAMLVYFLFPNVQLVVGPRYSSLVKIYPIPGTPGRSRTRVSHYFSAESMEVMSSLSVEESGILRVTDAFDSAIENEDYAAAETTQRAAESGLLGTLLFGRNEPALHHFHRSFQEALADGPET